MVEKLDTYLLLIGKFMIGLLIGVSVPNNSVHAQWRMPNLPSPYVVKKVDQTFPGISYVEIRDTVAGFDAYLVHLQTTKIKGKLGAKTEVFQAQNRLGKFQKLSELDQQQAYHNMPVIAAINGNFWIVKGQQLPDELLGQTHSGNMRNGVWITAPNGWNRHRTQDRKLLKEEIGYFYLDKNSKAFIDDLVFEASLKLPQQIILPIEHINGITGENAIGLFNFYAKEGLNRISEDAMYIKAKLIKNKKQSNKGRGKYVITGIHQPAIQDMIAEDEIVLIASGNKRESLKNLVTDARISINMKTYSRTSGKQAYPWNLLTGNAWVLKDATLTIRNTNENYNSMLYPRTGVGVSANGNEVFLMVIDRSINSKGASTAQMSTLLKSLGAIQATSLDGGGSAQLWFNGSIRNKPADGKERPVANGLIIYKP